MRNNTEGIMSRLIELWNRRDSAGAADMLADDVEYWDVTQASAFHSKAEVKEFFQTFFESFPNLQFELLSLFGKDNFAACEWKMKGTQAKEMPGVNAVGKSFELVGASICKVEDGRICRQVDYWDSRTMMRQLGLAP